MSNHEHSHPHGTLSENPVIQTYQEVNHRMHRDMAIELTGDADVDFIRGMIPHQQGAVDMARIVLAHGTDPEAGRERDFNPRRRDRHEAKLALKPGTLTTTDHLTFRP